MNLPSPIQWTLGMVLAVIAGLPIVLHWIELITAYWGF